MYRYYEVRAILSEISTSQGAAVVTDMSVVGRDTRAHTFDIGRVAAGSQSGSIERHRKTGDVTYVERVGI